MDQIVKVVELVAKFAWPISVVLTAMQFFPDDLAKETDIDHIRTQFRGELWLSLFLCIAVLLARYCHTLIRLVKRYVFFSLWKLLFPVRDKKEPVAQSRMRYYRIEVKSQNDIPIVVYQEIDSNGNQLRFVFENGERFVPDIVHEARLLEPRKFVAPECQRIDWSDIFSGDMSSGCWGISQP
jgi:hypothetical protein